MKNTNAKIRVIKIFLVVIILLIAIGIYFHINTIKSKNIIEIQGNVLDQYGYSTNEEFKMEAKKVNNGEYEIELPDTINNKKVVNYVEISLENQETGSKILTSENNKIQLTEEEITSGKINVTVEYETNEITSDEASNEQEQLDNNDDVLSMDSTPQDGVRAVSNTIKILFVKYAGSTQQQAFQKMDARLKANSHFQVDSKCFVDGEQTLISDYVLSRKGQYDLFILDTDVWDHIPNKDIIEQLFQQSNIITIGNDCRASTISMIESAVNLTATITPTMTNEGKNRLNFPLTSCTDGQQLIKFKSGVEVWYKCTCNGQEYDLMGMWKNSAGKVWIHSQYAIGHYMSNADEILERMIAQIFDIDAPTGKITASVTVTNQPTVTIYVSNVVDTGGSGVQTVLINGWFGDEWVAKHLPGEMKYDSTNKRYYATFKFADLPNTTSGLTNQGDGIYSFNANIYDNDGNRSNTGNVSVMYDTKVPTGTFSVSERITNKPTVTIYISDVQDTGGSGIDKVYIAGWYHQEKGHVYEKREEAIYDAANKRYYATFKFSELPNGTTNETNLGDRIYNFHAPIHDKAGNSVALQIGQVIYDTKSPTITVSPDKTENAASNNYVKSQDIKITVADVGYAGLADNSYQYILSTSDTKLTSTSWETYTNLGNLTLGENLTGTYYLFIKRVEDAAGNVSQTGGKLVDIEGTTYHRFGPYKFDNTVPKGTRWFSTKVTNQPTVTQYVTAEDTGGSGLDYVVMVAWYHQADGHIHEKQERAAYDSANNRYYVTFKFSEIPNGTTGETNLGDKTYSFGAVIFDKAGNIGYVSGDTVIYDTTLPTITVSPENTTNEKTNNYEKSQEITITVSDANGSGLGNNSYQYVLSESNTILTTTAWQEYINGEKTTIGTELTGTYYLFIKKVVDLAGNISKTGGKEVTIDGKTYQMFGPYNFDNKKPTAGSVTMNLEGKEGSEYQSKSWTNQSVYIEKVDGTDEHSGHNKTVYSITGPNTELTDQTGPYTLEDTGEYTITVTTTDNLGNVSTRNYEVKIDKVLPEAGTLIMRIEDENGDDYKEGEWTNKSVYVKVVDGSDEQSQHNKTVYTVEGPTELKNQEGENTLKDTGEYVITVTTTDKANNSKTREYTVKIDKVLPTAGTLIMKIKDENGDEYKSGEWTNEDVYIEKVDGSDEHSKHKSTVYNIEGPVSLENQEGKYTLTQAGEYTITVITTDIATNTAKNEYKIRIDKEAPVIKVTPDTTENPDTNNYVKNQEITINIEDSGSGLNKNNTYKYYVSSSNSKLEGGEWKQYTNGRSEIIGINITGTYYLFIQRVSDSLGNTSTSAGEPQVIEEETYQRFGPYYFDNEIPIPGELKMRIENEEGTEYTNGSWINKSVYIELEEGKDNHSGHESTVYSIEGPSKSVENGTEPDTLVETGEYTITVTTVDKLGLEATKVYVVRIDKEDPTGNITVEKTVTKEPTITVYVENVSDTGGSEIKNVEINGWYGGTFVSESLTGKETYDETTKKYYTTFTFNDLPNTSTGKTNQGDGNYEFTANIIDNAGNVYKTKIIDVTYDTKGPVIIVAPETTSNNSVKRQRVKVTIMDIGSGIKEGNSYEYYLSSSRTELKDGGWTEYTSGEAFTIGEDKKGTYYLFIKRVEDKLENTSTTGGTLVTINGIIYHRFGDYKFDYDMQDGEIYDTYYDEPKIGMSITLYDSNEERVEYEKLKGLYYEIDGTEYYPDKTGVMRIYLADNVSKVAKKLKMHIEGGTLETGKYIIRIENYAAYDGKYYGDMQENSVDIPISIINSSYGLKVEIADTDRLIDAETGKTFEGNSSIEMSIQIPNIIEKPNIRVSLYKRDITYDEELTYQGITYTQVDLQEYVTTQLQKTTNEKEYMLTDEIEESTIESFILDLKNSLLTGGYKLEFRLYSDDICIETVDRYLVVTDLVNTF